MSSLNKVQLIGRTGKDPEVRHLDSGVTVASFSLATSENYTNKQGEKVEQTEWHNIVAWGKLAEIIEKWVTKGQLLYIEGKLKTRKWEKDGQLLQINTSELCRFIKYIELTHHDLSFAFKMMKDGIAKLKTIKH